MRYISHVTEISEMKEKRKDVELCAENAIRGMVFGRKKTKRMTHRENGTKMDIHLYIYMIFL